MRLIQLSPSPLCFVCIYTTYLKAKQTLHTVKQTKLEMLYQKLNNVKPQFFFFLGSEECNSIQFLLQFPPGKKSLEYTVSPVEGKTPPTSKRGVLGMTVQLTEKLQF